MVSSEDADPSAFSATECFRIAFEAFKHAYNPYNKLAAAGAAFHTERGIFCGSTFQSCAYPTSICAIQSAAVNALSCGARSFTGLAFVGASAPLEGPRICGRCRDIIWQLGEFPILTATPQNPEKWETLSIGMLLPCSLPPKPLVPLRNAEDWAVSEFEEKGSVPPVSKDMAIRTQLAQEALAAGFFAYTPVSNFPVGAAVSTDKGIFCGSNYEHPVIGLGLCAERVAICKAVSAGARKIYRLAVVCCSVYMDDVEPSPCGACRQCMVEFENYPVDLIRVSHATASYSLKEVLSFDLLATPFTPSALGML